MKQILYSLIVLFFTLSCSQRSSTEKELQNILNKTLRINIFKTVQQKNDLISYDEFRQKYKYISVVFLQNGCKPCYPKFIEWQNKMDSIVKPDNYTVLFVIRGYNYGMFMSNILDVKYIEDQFYTIMDPDSKYINNNNEIPKWIIDCSILIDSENKIKMVGAPFATPEMTKLFHKICKE
jgi:hypothetical protein